MGASSDWHPRVLASIPKICFFLFMNLIILLEGVLVLANLGQYCHENNALLVHTFKSCFILESSFEFFLASILFL